MKSQYIENQIIVELRTSACAEKEMIYSAEQIRSPSLEKQQSSSGWRVSIYQLWEAECKENIYQTLSPSWKYCSTLELESKAFDVVEIHFTTGKDALLPAPSSLNELREIWNLLPLKTEFAR